MKFQVFIAVTAASIFLVGCNDVGSGRAIEYSTPPVETTSTETVSGIHREKGTATVTYEKEIEVESSGTYMRSIPDVRFDDDGADGKNASSRTFLTRPTAPCGLTPALSLTEKIADCVLKNSTLATWSGTSNAGSSEAIWKLVTLADVAGDIVEVWHDGRTGMVWSSIVVGAANWCKASGNAQAAIQGVSAVDCVATGASKNLCGDYSLVELPKVNWRLPTRNDYLQADLDGIRFVFIHGANSFWTATTSTDVTARNKAWTYDMKYGTLAAELMTTDRSVRCIGTTNF